MTDATPEQNMLFQVHAFFECLSIAQSIESSSAGEKELLENLIFQKSISANYIKSTNASIFGGLGSLIACLYILLVLPYEWKRTKPEFKKFDFSDVEKSADANIIVDVNSYKKPKKALSHLRNAIAHGHISQGANKNYITIFDQNPRNSKEKYEARLALGGVGMIAQELNNAIIKYINCIKEEESFDK